LARRAPSRMEEGRGTWAALKSHLMTQWTWVGDVQNAVDQRPRLRATVTTAREAVESARDAVQENVAQLNSTTVSLTTPSAAMLQCKSKALDIRRKCPALVVAFVAGLATVPAFRQGPRVIVRNFAVATTSACVLVYPELVLGIMPRCFARVQQKVAERRAQ